MSENTKELEALTKEVVDAIGFIREKADEIDTSTDHFKAEVKKAVDAAGESYEKIQQKQAREIAEHKARVEQLEVMIAKSSGSKAGDGEQAEINQAFNLMLKNPKNQNLQVSSDIQEKIARNYVESKMIGATNAKKEMAVKTLVEGSNVDGGFIIPQAMMNEIEMRVYETSPMRSIARVVQTDTNGESFPMVTTEIQSGWVGEADTRSQTGTPDFGNVNIPIHEMYAWPTASPQMIDDSAIDIGNLMSELAGDRFGRQENEAFVTGNGSQRPRGFLDYQDYDSGTSDYQFGRLERVQTGSANTVSGVDIKRLRASLFDTFNNNAVWTMSRFTFFNTVATLQDSEGRFLLNTNAMSIQDEDQLRLLGKRVVMFNDMTDATTTGSLPIAYGDFSRGYTIVDRIGMRLLVDPYSGGTDNRTIYKFNKRVGGAVTNFQAIKTLEVA